MVDVLELRHRCLFFKDFIAGVEWVDHAYISSGGKYQSTATATSHYTNNAILLKPGTYKLVGFSYQEDAGASNKTNFRIHAYNASDKWQRQITYKLIDWLSPVDIPFTLTSDTYVRLSIARKFVGHLIRTK